MKPTRLIVVDISSFIFRAFYAIRMLNAPDGTPVNAVRGVLGMLQKLLAQYQPTHIFLARDSKGPSFRHEEFEAYKANRSAPPEELVPQFALIEELITKMKLPNLAIPGFEADDIIGSAAIQWENDFDEIYLATSDKDLMQFVNGKVKMLDTMKDKLLGPDEVFEKMGVRPDQIVDYLSMVGDASDNIPGMKGIGAKGAAKLLEEYDTLEKCIENKESMKGKKLINAFENHIEDALLSKKLVTIIQDVDLKAKPKDLEFRFHPEEELFSFLQTLGFNTVLEKLKDLAYSTQQAEQDTEGEGFSIIDAGPSLEVTVVDSDKKLSTLLKNLESQPMASLHLEFTEEDLFQSTPVAAALSFDGHSVSYLPFALPEGVENLSEKNKLNFIETLLTKEDIELYVYNGKKLCFYFGIHDQGLAPEIYDISQAHYLVDTASRHDLVSVVRERTQFLINHLDKKTTLLDLSAPEIEAYITERCAGIFQVAEKLKGQLIKEELDKVYTDLDAPLIPILAGMERQGIRLNEEYLSELEEVFQKELSLLEEKVTEIAGECPNLKSPKQVSEMLFEKLQLPVIKKTKTGYSTDVEVLEELASRGLSEIPEILLKYRELDKILSTYVRSLPKMVNPISKKIHTTFHQNVAATGRLSSDNPNLQNIPIRSKNGRLVRKAFIAEPGKLLLAADYSQVELRILAHFSADPTMLQSFKEGIDIHSQTASEILGMPLDKVTSEDRGKAKAVNFGLMYGQSSFGLARALRINRKEAREYINMYFERFSKVKAYLDSLKEKAEEFGYSVTMFGRKRNLPDILSTNRTIKSNAERVAVNSPIQGTAADIIKVAMKNIWEEMKKEKFDSRMLLQVHDELIFEVPEDELAPMQLIVREHMENAVKLDVPLKVEMGMGVNWFDLK